MRSAKNANLHDSPRKNLKRKLSFEVDSVPSEKRIKISPIESQPVAHNTRNKNKKYPINIKASGRSRREKKPFTPTMVPSKLVKSKSKKVKYQPKRFTFDPLHVALSQANDKEKANGNPPLRITFNRVIDECALWTHQQKFWSDFNNQSLQEFLFGLHQEVNKIPLSELLLKEDKISLSQLLITEDQKELEQQMDANLSSTPRHVKHSDHKQGLFVMVDDQQRELIPPAMDSVESPDTNYTLGALMAQASNNVGMETEVSLNIRRPLGEKNSVVFPNFIETMSDDSKVIHPLKRTKSCARSLFSQENMADSLTGSLSNNQSSFWKNPMSRLEANGMDCAEDKIPDFLKHLTQKMYSQLPIQVKEDVEKLNSLNFAVEIGFITPVRFESLLEEGNLIPLLKSAGFRELILGYQDRPVSDRHYSGDEAEYLEDLNWYLEDNDDFQLSF